MTFDKRECVKTASYAKGFTFNTKFRQNNTKKYFMAVGRASAMGL